MNPYASGANKFKYRKDREPTEPDSNEFRPFVVRLSQEGQVIDFVSGPEHLVPIGLNNPDTNIMGMVWGDILATPGGETEFTAMRYPEIIDNNKNGLLDDDDVQHWESEGDSPLGINQVIVFIPSIPIWEDTGETVYLNTVDNFYAFIIEGTQSGKDIVNSGISEIDISNNVSNGIFEFPEEVSSAIREYVKDMFIIKKL